MRPDNRMVIVQVEIKINPVYRVIRRQIVFEKFFLGFFHDVFTGWLKRVNSRYFYEIETRMLKILTEFFTEFDAVRVTFLVNTVHDDVFTITYGLVKEFEHVHQHF
jgi:hypothetical protein